MDVGDLQLRFGRFRHVGKEDLEIAVFLLGLRQGSRAALGVPGIADRQLGAGNVFRIRIGVDQGLQGQARHVEAVVPHGVHGLVEQDLVRLLRPDLGQRVHSTSCWCRPTVNTSSMPRTAINGIRRDIGPRFSRVGRIFDPAIERSSVLALCGRQFGRRSATTAGLCSARPGLRPGPT